MQLKSFAAGAVTGILATIVAQQLHGRPDQPVSQSSQSLPAPDVRAEAGANSGSPQPMTVNEQVTVLQTVSEPEPGENDFQSHTQGTQRAHRAPPVPVTESHQELLDKFSDAPPDATTPNNARREFDDEPVDSEWSYFMEQSIGQYLATHAEIAYFDIAVIACRTTMCEIQSFGVDENAGPRWGLIVHDMKNQPWNDFGQTGSSSSTVDGRLVIFTHLWRQTVLGPGESRDQ